MALGIQKKYKCVSRMRALYHSVEQADRQEKYKRASRMRTLYHPVDIRSDTEAMASSRRSQIRMTSGEARSHQLIPPRLMINAICRHRGRREGYYEHSGV